MYQNVCDFSEPVNLGSEELPDFEFSQIICEGKPIMEITDGALTFYILPSVDLGDIFVMGFLAVFIGFLIFKFVWNFVCPQILKLKSRLDL